MMKAHSFVRENVPRFLTWAKDKTSKYLASYNTFCVSLLSFNLYLCLSSN